MKIFKILKRDLINIFKNPAALIIVLGICIVPSLYAWITLKANWDPYTNTGNLPVGIVNEDQGTIIKNNIVNAGDQVVNQLKSNKNIGWQFTTISQGDKALRDGDYYALIVIPSDFSKDLASLTTATPIKPTITYKVNDKTNIIATKITDVAQTTLTNEIKDNFIKAVNEQTISMANQLGEKLQTNKPVLSQLKDVMNTTDQQIASINENITNSANSASGMSEYLSGLKTDLPKITGQINSLQSVVSASKSLITSTQNTVNSLGNSINAGTPELGNFNNELQGLVTQVQGLNTSVGNNENSIKLTQNAIDASNKLLNSINSNISTLESINKIFNKQAITNVIAKLNDAKTKVQNQQAKIQAVQDLLKSGTATADQLNSKLQGLADTATGITTEINTAVSNIYSSVVPTLSTIGQNLTQGLNNADSLLESSKAIVPQLNSLANFGIGASDKTAEQAQALQGKLNSFKSQLDVLQGKANAVTDQDINQIINLLNKNPEAIASFLSSPIQVEQQNLYGEVDFGEGLSPFYTVLAIWVGSLLLTSLFTVECEDFEDGTKLNLFQRHFGKLLLFMILSFIQATIVTIGDKYILGLGMSSIWTVLAVSWLCSITFTIIIFTLVSLFGSMGKAIAIVIMVFQVAGSGAIYPIQTNPKIFGDLQFLWPFTYAIDAFREAIAGPDWTAFNKDMRALCIFAVVFLVLVVLKPLVHKGSHAMEHKFKEAGL